MDKRQQEIQQQNNNGNNGLSITAEELKSKLESNDPLMVFDIGSSKRYEEQHIPGSAYAVCDENSKKTIMPRLPKNIELIVVNDDEEYPRQIAEMMEGMGLKARYLKGGIKAWKWVLKRSESNRNISVRQLKEILDLEDNKSTKAKGLELETNESATVVADSSVFLLDVRESDEFRQWSIEGSVNIPLSELLSQQKLLDKIPKDRKIVTICPHGNRSTIAKYFLERYYYNVRSLEGGLQAWSNTLEEAYKEFEIHSRDNNDNIKKLKLLQVRRIGKGCMSYILESNGEAAVIDPVYPVEHYVNKVSEMEAKITKVFDTHQHADHISSAKELAETTGAIWYQSYYEEHSMPLGIFEKQSKFPLAPKFKPLHDGDLHKIGAATLKVIHTPGHTSGSVSFLVKVSEQNNINNNTRSGNSHHQQSLLFTGDTLFVDGIGRPDLRDKAGEFAVMLYQTLHSKTLPLEDGHDGYNIVVLPGHFDKDAKAGELISTTLGKVKEDVRLLKLPREEFIERIVSQVMPTPPNYRRIILINKGDISIPDSKSEVYELEIGPNRCSISEML
jgi:glyoxylase-like metal-dependent hydrolase (beta-lactamase superfamily II)/rhodanese-related sulfurtransferase